MRRRAQASDTESGMIHDARPFSSAAMAAFVALSAAPAASQTVVT